jgi:hypothetical protein
MPILTGSPPKAFAEKKRRKKEKPKGNKIVRIRAKGNTIGLTILPQKTL